MNGYEKGTLPHIPFFTRRGLGRGKVFYGKEGVLRYIYYIY
jgi:hypothetical protein